MLRAEGLLPQAGLLTVRFSTRRFPLALGSLLPDALALTLTGLAPAGEHGLARDQLFPSPHLPSRRPVLWARQTQA